MTNGHVVGGEHKHTCIECEHEWRAQVLETVCPECDSENILQSL